MNRRDQIGFSQRIHLDWLEYTANLVLAGNLRDEIVAALSERLREKLSVGNEPERGNRDKAISILTKVWVSVPTKLQALRDEGLDHLRSHHPNQRMLVHWCMCMAVYPFFGTVADAVGRLLRLQGTAGAARVQRRLRERYGERETVARAARRILRAYIDWAVLQETDEKGLYCTTAKRPIVDLPLALWTIKAVLCATGDTPRQASTLLHGPHLFPFDLLLPPIKDLEACPELEITRHGLDQEIVLSLSEQATEDANQPYLPRNTPPILYSEHTPASHPMLQDNLPRQLVRVRMTMKPLWKAERRKQRSSTVKFRIRISSDRDVDTLFGECENRQNLASNRSFRPCHY